MKSSRNTSTSGKPASGRRTPARKTKAKKKTTRTMPVWMRNTLALIVVGVFSLTFYYFVIRPYSYRWKECYGRKEYGVCIPCGYEVHGIDISHYQGNIDWKELKQNRETDFPLHFIFMKATEGGDHGDDTFTVKLDSGDLPPVLDVELTGKRPKKELQQNIKKWLDRVEAHYGVKPILYTSYKFKTRYLDDSLFNAYPYWIAHYYVDSVRYEGKWHFWQHTDIGSVPGIHHDVDLNVFNGSLEDLRKMTMR